MVQNLAALAMPSQREVAVTIALGIGACVLATSAYRSALPAEPPPQGVVDTVRWANAAGTNDRSGPRSTLRSIAIGANGIGLAGGSGGRLWRTTDFGRSWAAQSSPLTGINGVTLRGRSGLLVGAGGAIARTSDAGLTWTTVPNEDLRPLGGAAFVDDSVVVAIGERRVLFSTDAGVSWSVGASVPANLYDVEFRGPIGVIVGGSGVILRSTDAGVTWSRITTDVGELLRGVAFTGDSTAVAVGSNGVVLRSGDAGRTWHQVKSGSGMHLLSVAFADADNGVAVGMYGLVLRTRDGGGTWTTENAGSPAHLLSVDVWSSGEATAVGSFDTIVTGMVPTPSAER
jgi:photosystem II stability/assembly factor-like uncharacterized protein